MQLGKAMRLGKAAWKSFGKQHALLLTQQAHCSACVLYSQTHSGWNLKRQAMPHRGANCKYRDKGLVSRTFSKLYGSTPWRQARW